MWVLVRPSIYTSVCFSNFLQKKNAGKHKTGGDDDQMLGWNMKLLESFGFMSKQGKIFSITANANPQKTLYTYI